MMSAAALLAACTADDPLNPQDGDDDGNVTVQIRFNVDCGGSVGSRTETWGNLDNSEAATAFESTIESLHVTLQPSSSTNIWGGWNSGVEVQDVVAMGDGTYSGTATIADSLLNDDGTFSGWIVAYANFQASYGAAYERSTLPAYWFSYYLTADNVDYMKMSSIPMWGYLRCDNLQLTKGIATLTDPLYLLRSFAKIRVSLADDSSSRYALDSVKLTKVNGHCYVGCDVKKFSNSSQELTYASLYDVPVTYTANAWTTDVRSKEMGFKQDGDAFYVYTPEVSAEDDGMLTMELTYHDTNDPSNLITKEIEVGSYADANSDATDMDIIRNTIYDYSVTITPTDVNVALTVLPWNLVETNIGWSVQGDETAGIDAVLYAWPSQLLTKTVTTSSGDVTYYNVPNVDDATTGDTEAVYCYVTYPGYAAGTSNAKVTPDATGADFYLLITGDAGAVWQAHLSNEDDFCFDVSSTWDCSYWNGSETATKKLTSVSVGRARSNDSYDATTIGGTCGAVFCRPYRITVKPRKPWYTIPDDAEADNVGYYTYSDEWSNTAAGTTWETTRGYINSNREVVSGPYTELYITVELSNHVGPSQIQYLVINPPSTRTAFTSYYLDPEEITGGITGTRYRFYLGDSRGGSPGSTIRIYQLKATNKSDAAMAADNSALTSGFFTTTQTQN